MRPGNKKMRRWLLRAVGSLVILGLLFWFLPVDAIIEGFSRVPISLFVLVLLGFLAGHFVAAAKWWMLLGFGLPLTAAIRAHFAGLAGNLTLPGAAGGDAVRAAAAQLAMRDGARVISGSLADRIIDMLALACLSVTGVLMLRAAGGAGDAGGDGALALMVSLAMLVLLLGVVFVLPWLLPLVYKRIPALPAKGLALRTATAFATLGRRPLRLVAALVLSFLVQAWFIYLASRLGMATGVVVPMGAWFFAWPLAKILAVLPVSLNGLGLREATLAGLMAPFGAAGATVVAAGLVWQAVLFVTGGLGALVLAFSGVRVASDPPRPAKVSKVELDKI